MTRDTVAIHFVRAAIARLRPAARARAITAAGITEALIASPGARVPAPSFSALWLAVTKELGDEFFGLDGRGMKVGSFALLCQAAIGCRDLERALKVVLRGFGVFLDDIVAKLVCEDRDAVICIENRMRDPEARRFADETLLVMVHGLMCFLLGRRVPLLRAEFAWPAPAHANEYMVMFSEYLVFGVANTAIRFDGRHLASPVVPTTESLRAFLRDAPQSVFLKYRNPSSFSSRLRRHLRRFVGRGDWPVLEQVAGELHVSPTTLRRRLDAEFTSYQGIKDQVRRDAAIHMLCSSGMTVGDIALAVGFDEPSAFRRAFKSWSGVQPSEYRRGASQAGTVGRTRVSLASPQRA